MISTILKFSRIKALAGALTRTGTNERRKFAVIRVIRGSQVTSVEPRNRLRPCWPAPSSNGPGLEGEGTGKEHVVLLVHVIV